MGKRRDSLAERIAADLVLRLIWFVGAGLLTVFLGARAIAWNFDRPLIALGIPVSVGLLAAIVGPRSYAKARNRGRGMLSEIKAQSEMDEESAHND